MNKPSGSYGLLSIAAMILLLFAGSPALMPREFDNESRSVYILDISRYVQWSNIDDISVFKIGVLEPVDDLYPVIKKHTSVRGTIQDRPVEVVRFTDIDELSQVNLLYMNKKYDYDISLVLSRIRGEHTLLISENYEFHRSMINFIVYDGQNRFEMNEDRMKQEGLFVNELFKAHAITNEADWQKIYNLVELELEEEKLMVLEQNRVIDMQLAEISEQEVVIEQQESAIERQGMLLEGLENDILIRQRELDKRNEQIAFQQKAIEEQIAELEGNMLEMDRQSDILDDQKNQIMNQKIMIDGQDIVLGRQLEQIEKQRLLIWFFFIMLLFAFVLAYFVYNSYRIKREANIKLEEKNRMITRQRDEIEKQRDDISEQRDHIAEQNKLIWDSIHYAQRIQKALLPDDDNFRNVLNHFFIIYKPKDVVSGDFYWESKIGDEIIVVAADCTGHGVPGALMSMLGVTFLNDIVNTRKITRPSEILNNLRDEVINAFNQQGSRNEEIYDGMDIAVCCINQPKKTIQFSGANNPLILIRENEVFQFRGDRMPVAISDKMISFNNHTIDLHNNDQVYIFSDGYIDQFGGENNKKFMRKRLINLLVEIKNESMHRQKEILVKTFEEWKGCSEQTDDVVMIGLRI